MNIKGYKYWNLNGVMRCYKLVFLFFMHYPLFAQHEYDRLPVEVLTMEEGLLNNHINSIYQDRKGFIWIGTNEGLNKYDGLNFNEYSHNPNDTTSISSNVITNILEDNFGQLWIGTTRGLNRLSFDLKGFIKYKNNRDNNSIFSTGIISEIYEDQDSILWIGTGDGSLHRYNREDDDFVSFSVENKAELRAIKQGPHNTLILGYGAWVLGQGKGGISFFDKNSLTYHKDAVESLSGDFSVTNILRRDSSSYWISTYNTGLYTYHIESGELQKFNVQPEIPGFLNSNLIYGIYKDRQEILWIATDGGGINWLDKETGRISQFKNNSASGGLNALAITNVFEDRDGLFWVGTVSDGIHILNKYKSRIRHLSFGKSNDDGMSGKSVLALAASIDGGVWIGYDHGSLNYLNLDNESFTHFLHDPDHINSVSDEVINGLFESKSGELFIGTYLNGFDILNVKRDYFTHYGITNAIKNATYIKCFYEDRAGVFWMGSRKQGLIRFDRNTNTATNFKPSPNDANSINHNHISAILEENDHTLWIGTFNGLNQIDISTEKIKSWKHEENNLNSISGVQVYALCKDKNGGIWIGTDNGLNYYDRLKNNFQHFTIADGLPSNTIKGILNDEDNNLWISTNRGLSRFSISAMEFKNFGLDDGVLGLEFNENSAIKTLDGKLFFGSTNGINFFYPEDIKSNPNPPQIIITDILIANSQVLIGGKNSPLKKPISDTKSLKLTHKHTVFTFEFVALNFTAPQRNQYAYMLEGFDEKWNYVGTQNHATYTNINAGDYIFKVKASNNDGIWNEEGVALEVIILPPWWKTWWAFSIYLFVFAMAGIGARKSALSRIRLVNDLKLERLAKEKENEIHQIKLKFFTNLSHEFKTPLTLILGPLEKIISTDYGNEQMKKQFDLMYRNAGRLLRLINQLMDFRKINQGKMTLSASRVELISFVKEITENFQLLANDKNIQLKFSAQLDSQMAWIDEEKLDKVLYNLLSNAFNSTTSGDKITVSVNLTKQNPEDENNPQKQGSGTVAIAVKDTGRGISRENLEKIFERFFKAEQKGFGTGIGLSLSKSLVQLHKGELFVSSKLGKGSKFIVQLPLGNEHLEDQEKATQSTRLTTDSYLPQIPHLEKMEEEPNPVIDQNTRKLTLLVVEDDPDVRTFLNESLKENYNILVAKNGKQGLDLAAENNIELVISDIMMPQIDGLEFCKLMKSNINTSHIPIILLTAKTEETDVLEGISTGADEYITKPFSMKLLEARIKNLIDSRAKLKERFKHKLDLEPGDITITKIDNEFLNEAVTIIEKGMIEPDFNIEVLLKEMGMSRSHLFRKIKSLTGQPPNEFIHTIRFKNAAKHLLSGEMNVTEVAFKIGYATTKNFRNGFRKHFGKTPTEFVKDNSSNIPNPN